MAPDLEVANSQIMIADGGHPEPGPLVTREVRWFFDEPLPRDVKMWFTAFSTRGEKESRTDVYDRAAACRGVGVKRRNGENVDAKHRVWHLDNVLLAPDVSGCVEDWEKTGRSGLVVGPDQILITKEIVTLRYDLPDSHVEVGCEAELASLRVGPARAWSLCFETYGDPDLREESLKAGIKGLLGEGPLPEGLRLDAARSCGYPEWIRRLEAS